MAAFSLTALPARAGAAEDKAKKAFAEWKAAQAAVAAAKEKLADAQKALQNAMTAVAKSGGKATAEQEAALAGGRAAVARAEEALRLAEKQELAARVALESAIADLPDGSLKDQLKRERNFPSLVAANGLYTVKFDTPSGQLKLNLPDDIRAGDTISGTVVLEPKGRTEEERNANRGVLNGYVVGIADQRYPVDKGTVGPFVIRRALTPSGSGMPPPPPQLDSFFDVFVAVDLSTSPLGPVRIPLLPSGAVITPDPKITQPFNIPTMGQQGRPFVIPGPFDGDSSNTSVNWTPVGSTNPPNGFTVLAEGPGRAVIAAPTNVAGPLEVNLKEGGVETTSQFRNVGVNLSAPKTSLLRGESTELKVEVNGLEGIKQPVPLHLTKGGVVNMQGGDAQTMSIKPTEVSGNGTFTTTRTITGIQAGVWNATATVVVYNICLQDDTDPSRVLLFMSSISDFKFCPGHGSGGGATPTLSSTDFTGGISIQAGDGLDVTKSGAITAADFRFTGGHMKLQVDDSVHSGSATVQTKSPNQTFTITDRDTRNNSCTCQ